MVCPKAIKFSGGRSVPLSGMRDKDSGIFPGGFCRRGPTLHRTYISSIELGKVSVGIEVANELAAALGLRLSELVRAAE